jgi:hypothetical protein
MAPRASTTSITIGGEARTALDEMCERFGVDRSAMIERLILGTVPAHQHATDTTTEG